MTKGIKNKNTTSKLDEKKIDLMRKLRMHGASYDQIRDHCGISIGSVSKYCKGVQMLPESMRNNILAPLQDAIEPALLEARSPTYSNILKEKNLTNIDYLIDSHVDGMRFAADTPKKEREELIFAVPLERLQKTMREPTGYKSPLSVWKWAKYYLEGPEGRFLTHTPHKWSKLQKDMFSYWERHQRLMVETFRDAGKTMMADAVLLYCICENPESNYFVMSETKYKAGKRVKHIGDILLTNPRIIADYGFLPHVDKYEGHNQSWKLDEITVKRKFKQTDPTLMSFSSDSSNATGAHFAGGVFDDVWSFKLEGNSLQNKIKWLGWYDGELEGCLENAWELWILTRKGVTDLYQDIEDRQFHVVYKKPAIKKFPTQWEALYKKVEGKKVFSHIVDYSKDGEITDDGNGRFSMEFFLEKMKKMAADKWESEYQLNPTAAKGVFWKHRDLRWFSGHETWMHKRRTNKQMNLLRIVGFMDLAFGKSSRADYTALTIVALFDHKYYLLELYLKRGASELQMAEMIKQAYATFPLREVYIEADLQQTDRVHALKARVPEVVIKPFLSRQEMNSLYKEDSARRVDLDKKPLRIWSQLEAIIGDNKLYVNENMLNRKEFEDEFNTFPSCSHFDVLDALGNNISCLNKSAAPFFILTG